MELLRRNLLGEASVSVSLSNEFKLPFFAWPFLKLLGDSFLSVLLDAMDLLDEGGLDLRLVLLVPSVSNDIFGCLTNTDDLISFCGVF